MLSLLQEHAFVSSAFYPWLGWEIPSEKGAGFRILEVSWPFRASPVWIGPLLSPRLRKKWCRVDTKVIFWYLKTKRGRTYVVDGSTRHHWFVGSKGWHRRWPASWVGFLKVLKQARWLHLIVLVMASEHYGCLRRRENPQKKWDNSVVLIPPIFRLKKPSSSLSFSLCSVISVPAGFDVILGLSM